MQLGNFLFFLHEEYYYIRAEKAALNIKSGHAFRSFLTSVVVSRSISQSRSMKALKDRQTSRWWMSRADQTPRIGSDFSTSGRSHPCRPVATSVESILIIPPSPFPTIYLRTAMTRTIFPAAFNYPRTRAPTNGRALPREISIARRAVSLSLFLPKRSSR